VVRLLIKLSSMKRLEDLNRQDHVTSGHMTNRAHVSEEHSLIEPAYLTTWNKSSFLLIPPILPTVGVRRALLEPSVTHSRASSSS
jgi:hypothetical protein